MDLYPWSALPSATLRWRPVDGFVSGNANILGEDQRRNPRPGWRWQAELTRLNLNRPEQASLWEALLLNWRLGAELTLVPRFAGPLTPARGDGEPVLFVTHSDGSSFSDGGLYSQAVITATLGADLAEGAVTATIEISGGRPLRGGEPFSLTGETYLKRIYGVARILSAPAGGAADGTYVVRFGPPAREDIASGAAVDFDTPACVMRPRMEEGDKMWPTYERPFKARPSVTFVETYRMSDDG